MRVRDSASTSGLSLRSFAEISSNPVAFDLQNLGSSAKTCFGVVLFKNKIFVSFSKKFFEGFFNFRPPSTKTWPNFCEKGVKHFCYSWGHWTRWSEDVLCCAPLTRDVSPLLYSFVSQAYVRNTAQVREKLVRLDKF